MTVEAIGSASWRYSRTNSCSLGRGVAPASASSPRTESEACIDRGVSWLGVRAIFSTAAEGLSVTSASVMSVQGGDNRLAEDLEHI